MLLHMVGMLLHAMVASATPVVPNAAPNASPSATLDSGVVIGTTSVVSSATAAVTKFAGIPFAASPPLRFGPPKAVPSWTTPLVATTSRPACLQNWLFPSGSQGNTRIKAIFNAPGFSPPEESEDCLYLNVYTPPNVTSSSAKAVMFWIYGGDLAFGDGSLPGYDGGSLAYNQDVIVVTANYRTNVYGFPSSPELQAPFQNPGFLDQRFALRWVQTNIAAFGGDPNNVTIFGESAGGYSVRNLVALPPNPLPFKGAIMQSEAATPITSSGQWSALVKAAGCSSAPSQLTCMRGLSADAIQAAMGKGTYIFSPVQDHITHVDDVFPSFQRGSAAKVPILIGTNRNDGSAFAYIFGLDKADSLKAILQQLFPAQNLLDTTITSTLELLYAHVSVYAAASEILTDLAFLCQTSSLARFAQSKGYTVYRYLFDAAFPNFAYFPDSGVWHTSELGQVFGTYQLQNALGNATTQQINLSKYIQTAWANFAKNPAAGPMADWPQLGFPGKVQILGGNGSSGGQTVPAGSLDAKCTLLAPVVGPFRIIGV